MYLYKKITHEVLGRFFLFDQEIFLLSSHEHHRLQSLDRLWSTRIFDDLTSEGASWIYRQSSL
jgi:hypothetical protein